MRFSFYITKADILETYFIWRVIMEVNSKLRILYLIKIFLEKTDEEHRLSATELNKELYKYGISVNRKTIYSDIELLREFGIDILQTKGTNGGYYVGQRKFELPELKLLVDAVQASKFITSKKSEELIKKLGSLTSEYNSKKLRRNIFIFNRAKSRNETIYYNVDQIHEAILSNYQISFRYAEWTPQGKMRLKRNGKTYQVSPWMLAWEEENYYLIAYDEQAKYIKHYRVDKIRDAAILHEKRNGQQYLNEFDLSTFTKKTFSMYGGKDENVSLLCNNHIAGVIIDRFGKENVLIPVGKEKFRINILVSVSTQFFGWITGLGKEVQIEGPEDVVYQYKQYLLDVLKNY